MTTRLSIESKDDHALLVLERDGERLSYPLTLEETQRLSTHIQEAIQQVQWNIATWLFAIDPKKMYENEKIHFLPKVPNAKQQRAVCGKIAPREEGWYVVPIVEEPNEHIGICLVCYGVYEMYKNAHREGEVHVNTSTDDQTGK